VASKTVPCPVCAGSVMVPRGQQPSQALRHHLMLSHSEAEAQRARVTWDDL